MKRSGGRLWGRVIAVLAVLALLVPAGFTAVQMGGVLGGAAYGDHAHVSGCAHAAGGYRL